MEEQVRLLAKDYLTEVRQAQERLRARCPFCDHKRTFVIDMNTGLWHCFACEAGGGFLWFFKQIGMPAKQVEALKKRLGIFAAPQTRTQSRKTKLEQALAPRAQLPEYILGAYQHCPLSLIEAGFDEDLLFDHEVGFDFQHDRITFPIRDWEGRLVAISGRAHNPWVRPKYKVYEANPEGPTKRRGELYGIVENYEPQNRDHLYGLHTVYARRFFSRAEQLEPLIIVEGYKACLWLRQQGFADTVAVQGSSLTQSQALRLQRLRGPYLIFLDGELGKQYPDNDRRWAALRIYQRLARSGRTALVTYPGFSPENPFAGKEEGTSPDDLSSEELAECLQSPKTPTEIEFSRQRGWRRKTWATRSDGAVDAAKKPAGREAASSRGQ